jgi:hypothetical protein
VLFLVTIGNTNEEIFRNVNALLLIGAPTGVNYPTWPDPFYCQYSTDHDRDKIMFNSLAGYRRGEAVLWENILKVYFNFYVLDSRREDKTF